VLLGVPGVLLCIAEILKSELSTQMYYRTYLWNRLLRMSTRSGCQTPVLHVLQRVPGVLKCIADVLKSALASQCTIKNAHGIDFGEYLPEAAAEHVNPMCCSVLLCVTGVFQCIAEILNIALASQCTIENAHRTDFGEYLPQAAAEHVYFMCCSVMLRVYLVCCSGCRNSGQCVRFSIYYRKCL